MPSGRVPAGLAVVGPVAVDSAAVGLTAVDLGPGVAAGFTGRRAGDLQDVWARARLAAELGAPLVFAHQVHGNRVLPVSAASPTAAEGDALITADAGVALGVLVADCVPVLLADPVVGLIATAHAGRAGTLSAVVGQTVAAMVEAGGLPARMRAAIGPAICGRCYEVPAEMAAAFLAHEPAAASTTSWGTPALDLPRAVEQQLRRAGVGAVQRSTICTREDAGCFSHRRATAAGRSTGRQAGIILRSQ
ncbi:MAG: peptidoglycan editing factor PgeF [Promicromonosporaceae bacterium]|nr:peptidoglycan editing factor PgeF [Promicromonosporaceae bacterium]